LPALEDRCMCTLSFESLLVLSIIRKMPKIITEVLLVIHISRIA
jgi:hypothetical protein